MGTLPRPEECRKTEARSSSKLVKVMQDPSRSGTRVPCCGPGYSILPTQHTTCPVPGETQRREHVHTHRATVYLTSVA